jgi:hypothetical protein
MSRRRIITYAIVFLLLGAIVNVAVAWGCAMWWPSGIDYVASGEYVTLANSGRSVHVNSIALDRSGWPRRSMAWASNEDALLPTKLAWPGFAINTVFYAAVLWMLFAAPFALRRWRRIRRGLCSKCGYDLRGGMSGGGGGGAGGVGGGRGAGERAVCPECGTPVVNAP